MIESAVVITRIGRIRIDGFDLAGHSSQAVHIVALHDLEAMLSPWNGHIASQPIEVNASDVCHLVSHSLVQDAPFDFPARVTRLQWLRKMLSDRIGNIAGCAQQGSKKQVSMTRVYAAVHDLQHRIQLDSLPI